MSHLSHTELNRDQTGMSLMSVLVAMVILSVVSLALSKNTIASLHIIKLTEVNYAASNLAVSKVEELAARNPIDLDDSFDDTENAVTTADLDITFTRVTDVTVNADDTRIVHVTVTSNSSVVNTTADFETSLSVWE